MARLTTTHLAVGRTARVAVLGAEVDAPAELWVAIHGYRQLAHRFLRRFAPLADGSRRIVGPEGLSRFYLDEDGGRHGPEHRVGASWMTRHDREMEIHDYVAYLDAVVARGPAAVDGDPRRVVLGFSQGVHTAVRWVVRGATVAPHTLVLWGAGLPRDLDTGRARARLKAVRVVFVRGRTDRHRHRESEPVDEATLASWGLQVEVVEHPGGHILDGPTLEALAGRISGG